MKGPRLRVAIPTLVLGIVLAISGVVALGVQFWDLINGPRYAIPGKIELQLDTGLHTVFERTGSRDRVGSVSVNRLNLVTLDRRQLKITGPDGESVFVGITDHGETIDVNAAHFVSALQFDAARGGRYTLTFATDAGEVMIRPSLGELFHRNLGWFLTVAGGGLLGCAGFVMLIVGVVRRSSAKRMVPMMATPEASSPPAGWFADPSGAHRLRYWDGTTWTDHISE